MALSKNEIKLIKSLQIKKSRESNRLFVVEGVKLVEELLQQKKFKIDGIFFTEDFEAELPKNIHSFKISPSELEVRIYVFNEKGRTLPSRAPIRLRPTSNSTLPVGSGTVITPTRSAKRPVLAK